MPIYPGKTKGTFRVVLWAPTIPDGPSKQHEKTFTGSARDAKLFEAQWRVQLRAATRRELRGVPRFTAFCVEIFTPYIRKRVAKTTWDRHYAWGIAALCEHFGDLRLSDFSTLGIQEYQTERDAGPATVNGEVILLMSILNYARDAHNVPVQKIEHKPFTTMKGRPKAWNETQCAHLLATARRISPWQVPMLIFGLNTGCRKGEIIACEWPWIDLDLRMVRIPVNEFWHPKDGEPREVPMADAIYASLTTEPAPVKMSRDVWPVRPRHERWVFPTRDGGRFGEFPDEPFRRLLDEAELDGSPHWIRHTFASMFLRKKPDLMLLADIMGHSTTYVTEMYRHMLPDHLAEGRNVVNIGAGPVVVPKKNQRA
jgi:integrase